MDTIANMFAMIMTGMERKKETVDVPHSREKENIAAILARNGFIGAQEVVARGSKKVLRLKLRYKKDKFGHMSKGIISKIKRISKPGCRVYAGVDEIPRIMSGYGTVIMSTSRGIISGEEASQQKVGGEVIAYVW
ncbi:MAG: 30S ribosomal protein S8 [Candidatus Margulisiibacteriota bacterium]|nr:30S ribosomal protein S8 [Candidatus Margulisiibacteriota bacterium]